MAGMSNSTALGLFVLGAFKCFAGACALFDFLHYTATKDVAFEEAKTLSRGKGVVNLGAGPHRTYQAQIIAEAPEILANIDIAPDGMPHFLQLDIEREALPFSDKQFGCVFLSHVLEHLDNWRFTLAEASRVADYVVVVLPHPQYFSGWLTPEHKQHFSVEDIAEICQLYSNVEVYY